MDLAFPDPSLVTSREDQVCLGAELDQYNNQAVVADVIKEFDDIKEYSFGTQVPAEAVCTPQRAQRP